MKYDEEYTDEFPEKASGKGFYIALAVCLVAVCGVAIATFVGNLSGEAPKPIVKGTTAPTVVQQVVIPATDVQDERTTVTTTVTTTLRPTTTTAAESLFVFPASNRVIAFFSDSPVFSETLGEWGTHNGVDFEAKVGSAVKAPAGGTVKAIYSDGLWGDTVEIDHGGKVFSRCRGVKVQELKAGDTVKAGDVIGTVSEIPAEIAEVPHLHLEVLANDKYVDPLLLIRSETVSVTKKATTASTAATSVK